MISQNRLKELLYYDKDTGIFTWIKRVGKLNELSFKYNKKAGWPQGTGYLCVCINRKYYLLHRLAWLYVYNEYPNVIDHIDGNKTNNSIINLRNVTLSTNNQNIKKARSNNKTGYLGVSFNKQIKKFTSQIRVNGKLHYLGTFHNAEDAHKTYLDAKRKLHEGCTI